MKSLINWKLFFILLIGCVIASLLVIPYSLELSLSQIEYSALMLLLSIIQSIVLFSVVIFFGLVLSKHIGMGMPILQNTLEGKKQDKTLKSIIGPSVLWGILSGLLIVLLSIPFNELIPELNLLNVSVTLWKSFLAAFYGGIAEEILLRLFLVSLFVWITWKIKKTKNGTPTDFGVWLSIILAAVFFWVRTSTRNSTDNHIKRDCYITGYSTKRYRRYCFWMALLEKGFRVCNVSSFFGRYCFAYNYTFDSLIFIFDQENIALSAK